MTDFDNIALALEAVLDTVSNVGITHAFQRWSNNWSDFLDLTDTTIASEDQIRFWMIGRERVSSEAGEAFGQVRRTHHMVIIGALGVKDSANTYTVFQQLVDSVIAALDTRKDLGLSAVVDYGVGPCSVRTLGEEAVGGVLCHVCEIEVPVVTEHQITFV